MPKHIFSTTIAKEVGINAAVILENISFWISKNKELGKNFNDGKYWEYCSFKDFSRIFEYLSEEQIKLAIKKLVDNGFILKGNYNKLRFDKTNWYALTEKSERYLENESKVVEMSF